MRRFILSLTLLATVIVPSYAQSYPSKWKLTKVNGTSFEQLWAADRHHIKATECGDAWLDAPKCEGLGEGDSWTFHYPVKDIPAGTFVEFDFALGTSAGSPRYIAVEYLDGRKWVAKDTVKCIGGPNEPSSIIQTIRFSKAVKGEGELLVRLRPVGDEVCTYDTSVPRDSLDSHLKLMPYGYVSGYANILGTDGPKDTVRVGYLGNSFTYVNATDFMLKELAWNEGHFLDISLNAYPGASFKTHLRLTGSLDVLHGEGYEWFFVQDQSQQAAYYGRESRNDILDNNRSLAKIIRHGSPDVKIVYEETWAYSKDNFGGFGSFEYFDACADDGAARLAEEINATVSPIAQAFSIVRKERPDINLYSDDDHHQSAYGAYLKASVNCVKMFGPFTSDKANFALDAEKCAYLRQVAERAVLGNEVQKDLPKGEMLSFEMKDSAIYPGTVRNIQVYVPAQYDGKTPACLFVRMDGLGHNIPQLFDELIDEGAMPVTVAVFVTSGRVLDEEGNVVRYNRSNEFDRMTSTWARFLDEEVVAQVEKLTTSDGRRIVISRNAADRAINGDSSGGIAAFNAAWQRPDLFSRVYSIVGTFVPFRGGDNFPALIRKNETKPLRIFLQDNDKDSWNLTFGSWYEYNQLMYSALKYAGYDMQFHWDKGGHSGNNGGRIMKDVLRWLWKDWPQAPVAGKSENGLVCSLVIPGEGWKECPKMDGNPSFEATYPGGDFVVYSKPYSNVLMSSILDGDGKRIYEEEFYWLHSEGGENTEKRFLAFDTEGWLYASSTIGIQVCDHNGRVRAIIDTPDGELQSFSFVGNTLYVKVDGKCYCRKIGHNAADGKSLRPKSQGQG